MNNPHPTHDTEGEHDMTEHLITCEGSGRDGRPVPTGFVTCGMCGKELPTDTGETPTHHRHNRHHEENEHEADVRIRNQFISHSKTRQEPTV